MNIIPFVFAILLILSYSMASSFQARLLSHRNQKAYVALRGAELDILRKSEMEQFKSLSGDPVKKPRKSHPPKSTKAPTTKIEEPLEVNAPCAKLNLYPLVLEGEESHPNLYEISAKMLRIFYQKQFFPNEKRFEYKLLDAIIAGAKTKIRANPVLAIETIPLQDPALQPLYYALLKGTKHYKLSETGCPPLLDYWKIEKEVSQICLFHCHSDMLTVFFGPNTALKLYDELHVERKKAGIPLDAILAWGTDPQLRFVAKEVWDLLNFKRPEHSNPLVQTMFGKEEDVSIRKNVLLKNPPK